MKSAKHIFLRAAFSAALLASAMAHAQTPAPAASAKAASAEMAEGQVRKIDKENSKITLKHGEIKSLDMPPMTMVFQVSDAALLDKVKPGDKIRFRATNEGGRMTVTEIQAAK